MIASAVDSVGAVEFVATYSIDWNESPVGCNEEILDGIELLTRLRETRCRLCRTSRSSEYKTRKLRERECQETHELFDSRLLSGRNDGRNRTT